VHFPASEHLFAEQALHNHPDAAFTATGEEENT
jgi:hypothetical protein